MPYAEAMQARGAWQVRVMGEVALVGPGGAAQSMERKMAACFAYLVLEGPTYRARLADLLWPNSPEATGKNNLAQLLRKVRLTTGVDLIVPGNPLRVAEDVAVDVARARDLYAQGQAAELLALPDTLLPGLTYDDCPDLEEWAEAGREEVRGWFVQVAAQEAARLEGSGDYAGAQALAGRWLALEPHSEEAARLLMRALYAQGDRSGALRAYARCVEVLRREFGVGPLPDTQRLAHEIDQGRAAVAVAATVKAELPLAVLRPPRLLGREREWAQMEQAHANGQWVFVGGEPGSGKTRLVLDFAASKGNYLMFPGRPGDRAQPWSTTARMYRTSLAERPHLHMDDWVRRELSRIVPELARPGETLPPIQNEEQLLRQREAYRLFSVDNHAGMASTVSDDWQFYDDQTNLNGLYMFGAGPPLGTPGALPPLLVTYRTGELPPESVAILEQTVASGMAVHLVLGPLPDSAVDTLMDDIGVPDDPVIRARLLEHTGGHPVFLLETVKLLIETGGLRGGLPEKLPLPDKVKQVIERRLHGLSTPALQAARAAAVLQRDFNVNLVADLLGAPLLELVDAWTELEGAQVVRGNNFWHDLVLETVASQIPAGVRVLLHRNAARALERAGADPLRIAEHWLLGENPQAATPFLRRAEQAARAGYRLEEAQELRDRLERIRAELGPLDDAPAPADGLPVPVTSFHGRDAEQAGLLEWLRGGARLVTLTGPGGVGKTRLALEVARTLAPHFPDGTVFVPLADVHDPATLPRVLARRLGLPDDDRRPPREAALTLLQGKRLLLVLDNLEQVLGGAGLIADVLQAAAGVQVLATSRTPLNLTHERVFPVAPLPLPTRVDLAESGHNPALALFLSRAQAAHPQFRLSAANAPEVRAILEHLDGLPLAIELAAPRLRTMPPATLLLRLRDALGALERGPRDLPERHQALRATIAWSVKLLPEPERALLRRLAVFIGGWTLDTAEAVGDPDGTLDVLEGLGTLIDHSLVRWLDVPGSAARYGLLSTVRAYALEELQASGEAAATRLRLVQAMTDLAERTHHRIRQSLSLEVTQDIEAEAANIRCALDILLGSSDLARATPLLEALAQALWVTRSVLLDEPVLRQWAEHPALPGQPAPVQARLCLALGAHLYWRGELTGAAERLARAAQLFRELGDDSGLVQCQQVQVLLLTASGALDQAESLALKLLERTGASGQAALQVVTMHALLLVLLRRGDPQAMRHWAGRLRTLAGSHGDLVYQSHAVWHLFAAAQLSGQREEAARHALDYQALVLPAPFPAGWMVALMCWASLALDAADDERLALILGAVQALQGDALVPPWSVSGAALQRLRARTGDLEARFPDALAQGRTAALEDVLRRLAAPAAVPL